MPSEFERHFEESRREWTARKHKVVGHFVHVAIAKMKLIGRSESLPKGRNKVALVDGYAGENQYGEERIGSTIIMANEAKKAFTTHGTEVRIFACEADPVTYASLCENLKEDIDSGLVTVLLGTHADNLPTLVRLVSDWPTVVFLDPHKPDQMSVERDIAPWTRRKWTTDVLGTFFGGSVARMVGGARAVGYGEAKLEEILGPGWHEVQGEYEAYDRFKAQISSLSKFSGMYLLRKRNPNRIAYGIFGLSASAHGMALLSDATARDFHELTRSRGGDASLFDDDPEFSEKAWWDDQLKVALRPLVQKDTSVPGKKLMVKLFEVKANARFFGRFVERHFNQARAVIKGEIENAKAK